MGGALDRPVQSIGSAPQQCVILVGGLGTRLGALTGGAPKPLTAVAGRPFLSYLVWHARRMGFSRVLLLAGHRGEHVLGYRDQLNRDVGLHVEVAIEPEPLGTAGALRFASRQLEPRFLLLNGDSLFDFNWLNLVTSGGPDVDAVMAVRRATDASRFGVVELDGERVTRFRERGDTTGGLINGGVYVLTQALALACPVKGSLEQDVLPSLAAAGRVKASEQTGFFLDIGVPEALAKAQEQIPASLTRGARFFSLEDLVEPQSEGSPARLRTGSIAAVRAANDSGRFAFMQVGSLKAAAGWLETTYASIQTNLRDHGAHLDDLLLLQQPEKVGPEQQGLLSLGDQLARWPIDAADCVRHRTDVAHP